MGLAEHEGERHNEELIALIVADMQDPVTPILEATLVGDGLHNAGRVIASVGKIVYHGAAVVEEHLPGVRAMEEYTGHVQPPSDETGSDEISTLLLYSTARYESHGSGTTLRWSERKQDHVRIS